MEVQIVIKAPNQNVDDHVVPCNLNWTVQNLKDHLSKAYPNKPMVNEQKLIYSGRLLHNNLQLKDVLRHEDSQSSVHILHLVCSSDSSFAQPSQNWSNSSKRHPSVVNDPVSGQSTSNTLRQRNVASVPPTNAFYPQFPQNLAPQVTMPVFIPDSQVAAQMAAMQQMYAYYFSQYIQSMNPANNPTFTGTPTYQPHQNVAPPQNQNQPNQRHQPNQNRPVEENDEVPHRDWLDHIFLCCRFLILFSLVYFYSTPERLMIVIIFAVIAFLYQEGWFVRRVAPPVPEEVPVPQENQNVPHQPDLENNDEEAMLVNHDLSANDDGLGEYELEAAMDGNDPPHAQRQTDDSNNNHIFSPLTFLSTFFSSLIPDPPPPPININ